MKPKSPKIGRPLKYGKAPTIDVKLSLSPEAYKKVKSLAPRKASAYVTSLILSDSLILYRFAF